MDSFNTNSSAINYTSGNIVDMLASECTDHPAGTTFWVAVEVVVFTLGLPANILVLWILLRNKSNSSSSTVFTLHLAVMDSIYCIILPIDAINHFFFKDYALLFQVLILFFALNVMGGPLFLSCMCMDWYIAVMHPITYIRFKDGMYRHVFSAVIWALTVAYGIFTSYTFAVHFNHVVTAVYTLVLLVMVFCNISILRALRQTGPGRDEIHPMKKKAFKIVLTIFIIMLVNHTPALYILLLEKRIDFVLLECYVVPIVSFFITIRSCLQPVYFLFSKGKLPCQGNSNRE